MIQKLVYNIKYFLKNLKYTHKLLNNGRIRKHAPDYIQKIFPQIWSRELVAKNHEKKFTK